MRCSSNDGAEPPPLRIKLPADARSRRRNGIWPPAHRDDGGSASPPRPQEDLLRRRSGSAAALNDLEKSKRMVCLPHRWDPQTHKFAGREWRDPPELGSIFCPHIVQAGSQMGKIGPCFWCPARDALRAVPRQRLSSHFQMRRVVCRINTTPTNYIPKSFF